MRRRLRELALFAGAGGGILGGCLLGWRTICAVEINSYARRVLLSRQRDGVLNRFPIWDDIRTFDGKLWRGKCDVISGGFPCTDISVAGNGAGIEGAASGLWKEMARVVSEVRPEFVFVENSPLLTHRGLQEVLGDLAKMGYDAKWCVLGADDVGAPHIRKRIWIFATNSLLPRRKGLRTQYQLRTDKAKESVGRIRWWAAEPDMGRVAYGEPCWVDRITALGNEQVPAVVALAWKILTLEL